MKKKLFNILLMFILIFSFVACAPKSDLPNIGIKGEKNVTKTNKDIKNNDSKNNNSVNKESESKQENKIKTSKEEKSTKSSDKKSTEIKKEIKKNVVKDSKNKLIDKNLKDDSNKKSINNSKETKKTTNINKNIKEKSKEKNNICTISIECRTAINKGVNKKDGFTHLPSNGIILPKMKISIKDGDTVYDVLHKVIMQKKIHMEFSGGGQSIYIKGIDNLYEMDCGDLSGWKYCVNNWYPNYGCGAYKVKSGDVVEWKYTCDLGKDLGQ
ncbi:DUF4430 domain-containing protein [Hathewaya limosa]|uniref:Transcobalamin-like C-terminal domain-containing protein n=1 Tax=Hathewaya limosa TaxID=1536 RepID=A0ABU0JUQ9_HATLI|nr:DUF4430 domain-containing protein [Hathewaya limosa]MDQ0480838.1 hypothetical protein [Hathewaya limosa]